MAKEAFYFSHDTGARNDPKLQKVLMKLGHTGKSVYWDLVEMLHEEGGYLMLSECENYAFALRTEAECISSLIKDFNLFDNDGKRFWSNSALRRIEQREIKSKKAAESAFSRWKNANAQKKNANAVSEKCEGNAIKERKGKEIKESKDYIEPFSNIKILVEEDEKLMQEVGLLKNDCYKFLSDYKVEKNYKTKSDYLTIKRWVIDAVKKNKPELNGNTSNASGATIRQLNKHEAGLAGALDDLKADLNSRGISNL